MSVPVERDLAKSDRYFIARTLINNFGSMEKLGPPVLMPFLQGPAAGLVDGVHIPCGPEGMIEPNPVMTLSRLAPHPLPLGALSCRCVAEVHSEARLPLVRVADVLGSLLLTWPL
jgi:hypothetical protein